MSVVEILFSPTGGTKKVADIVAEQYGETTDVIDLSENNTDFNQFELKSDDLAVIAMPSFGGRAPEAAVERLKKVKGNGADCILICVYGNRDYEDTLVEMEDAARESGFNPIATIAAVAQHSIMPQFASGRPDQEDQIQLQEFAQRIKNASGHPKIPGNRPYKKVSNMSMVPKKSSKCNNCGICVVQCPVGAIDRESLKADKEKCISCMRCIAICPQDARQLNKLLVKGAAMALKKACSERKENQLFI